MTGKEQDLKVSMDPPLTHLLLHCCGFKERVDFQSPHPKFGNNDTPKIEIKSMVDAPAAMRTGLNNATGGLLL